MSQSRIDISVVVPTHNRCASLMRTLAALGQQQFVGPFEVIVSDDGSTDGTPSAVSRLSPPFPLHVLTSRQPRGAAAARNRGAEAARGSLLVFLDDDIEASPRLLAAHADAHRQGAGVTTGYLPARSSHATDFFQITLRRWWEGMFTPMRRPGHRYNFRDVLTGNCAIDADVFARLGCFDERFVCHEDYEFGVRAVEAGVQLRFVPRAHAVHHERTTLPRAFERKQAEGRADVEMIRKHPHLVPSLPLGVFAQYERRRESWLRRMVFARPAAARMLAKTIARSLQPLEAARLRGRWLHGVYDLLTYWYWRGVAQHVPTWKAFCELVADCDARARSRNVRTLVVDLADGLQPVMRLIDERRPHALSIMFRAEHVGEMKYEPGAERLRGEHLRAAMAAHLAGPFVSALGRCGVVNVATLDGMITPTGRLPDFTLQL